MLRHLREEAQPLAIDREVACFLAAGRKPVAIKVERGGLQIVGVANDAQHRAASARDLAGFDLLAFRLDRLVGPDTKVHAIIGRRRGTPLGTPDIEGRTCLGVQASGLAPRDEPLDGGAERRRIAPMLYDRHRRWGHQLVADSRNVLDRSCGFGADQPEPHDRLQASIGIPGTRLWLWLRAYDPTAWRPIP